MSESLILILEVGEFRIEYSPISQLFRVVDKDGTERTWKPTQKECQDYIDEDNSTHFPPKPEPTNATDEPIRECYFCGKFKRASKGKVQEFDNGKLMHPREEHWVCFDPCIKVLNDGGLKVSAR